MGMRTLLALLCSLALVASACGDDDVTAGPTDDGSTTTLESRGWLEGDDLEWRAGGDDDAGGDVADFAPASESGESLAYDEDSGATRASTVDGADIIGPEPPPIDTGPLKAGSIDDGADVSAYLEYRARITDAGVPVRPLDVSDPTVVAVTGSNGLPVLDAVVEIVATGSDTADLRVELRTTADGTVRFLPNAHTMGADDWTVTVTVGDTTATSEFARGAERVELAVDGPGGIDGSVPVDVHFVLDATGSMGDEIGRLRDNMTTVATQIDALPSEPDVRFGMTVYRDEGDAFVTRTFDLTGDLDGFLVALDEVVAEGGGDYPEALDEALADALEKPSWRRDGAVELIIVIADAPPQVAREVQLPTTQAALDATERGVKILPVAASGTDDQAEYVMRELAFVTGGRFVFLSYGVGGSATGGGTDITPDDYDELPLDQLVVRLVEDEINALTGGEPTPVTTTTAPVTTTTYEQ